MGRVGAPEPVDRSAYMLTLVVLITAAFWSGFALGLMVMSWLS